MRDKVRLKILALLVLTAAIGIAFYETDLLSLFLNREKMMDFLASLGPFSFIGFILIQAVQVVVSPIPGEVTGFIGGFLYGTFLGIALSTIGLTLGSWAAFSLARIFGRPLV